jgi:hypothetical protein
MQLLPTLNQTFLLKSKNRPGAFTTVGADAPPEFGLEDAVVRKLHDNVENVLLAGALTRQLGETQPFQN